jgi:hypothetical protein
MSEADGNLLAVRVDRHRITAQQDKFSTSIPSGIAAQPVVAPFSFGWFCSSFMIRRENNMNKKLWLKIAAGLSFFMAICQTVISLWPAPAAYFEAPPSLLENRMQLFLYGEGAALILIVFGLYALSGAGSIRRLPLLRLGLIGISSLFLLRGLFFIISLLIVLGVLRGEILIQGEIATLLFLAAGISYAVGTGLNWKEMRVRR